MLGDWMAGFREQAIPFGSGDAGLENISWDATKTLRAPGMEWTQTTQGFNALVKPEEASAIRAAMNLVKGGGDGAVEGFDQLKAVSQIIQNKEYIADMQGMVDGAFKAAKDNDSLLQFINTAKEGLQAGSQGAVAAAGAASSSKPKQESYYVQTRPLSEGQVYMLFDRVLTEAGILDKLKAGAGKAVGAVAKGAAWAGKQATEKITSAKLLASWKLEGSPTDSEELKQFLLNYGGIDTATVDKVYADLKISAAPAEPEAQAATGGYAEVKKAIMQLNTKDRKRMITYLAKQLGTA
jgi:hypothetical protein